MELSDTDKYWWKIMQLMNRKIRQYKDRLVMMGAATSFMTQFVKILLFLVRLQLRYDMAPMGLYWHLRTSPTFLNALNTEKKRFN